MPTADDIYRSRRGYYASTSYIDDKLGDLIAQLARLDLSRDTVVIFTSDHGDQCGEHGMWFKRIVREWSSRVPLMVAGPGVSAGRRVDANVSLVDLYPTLLDLAGLRLPEGIPFNLDGHSLAAFLRGEEVAGWPDEVIIENYGEATIKPIRALVKGRYKYIYTHERPAQLYDLRDDPDEWRDLAGAPAYAPVADALRARLLDGWVPVTAERRILESQRQHTFLKEALLQGAYTPWDYQPVFDATRRYVRRTSNVQWAPHLGR